MAENQPGTLESLAIEMAKIFDPVKERIEDGDVLLMLAELGIRLPDSLASDTGFTGAIENVSEKIGQFPSLINGIIKGFEQEDYATVAEKTVQLLQIIAGLADDFQVIADEIEANKPY